MHILGYTVELHGNATFQRIEVVERVELKTDGQDSLPHRKNILYFQGKYIKSQRLTVEATTGLFLVTLRSAAV
jgi:hypothetical protein